MELQVVDIDGNAHARGEAYGAQRRDEIAGCIEAWLQSLSSAGVGDPRTYIEKMLRETDFVSAITQYAPDLLDEVRGMAAGAKQPFELLFAAQLMDEEWAYRTSANDENRQKCSSVGVRSSDGSVLIGQNMDLGGYTDGHQVLFRLAPHAGVPGALIFSISSMIALLGVNSSGVAVCVNSIPQVPAARHGLPVAFVIRKLLQARTLADAVETVRNVPHATGQHYLLADATSIRSFEASSEGVVEYVSPDPTGVLHTNHPLAPPYASQHETSINSLTRLACLRTRLGSVAPGVQAVQAALSSRDDPEHPVSRTHNPAAAAHPLAGLISFTTGSMISRLRPDSRDIDIWVSPGPPSERGYTHVPIPSSWQR